MRTHVLRTAGQVERLVRELRAEWKEKQDAGRPLEVVVSEYSARRTDAQNRLYWARLRDISRQVRVEGRQHTEETWHEFFKRRFIGFEELPGGGMLGLSTTTLDVGEFSSYIGKVEAWAVENHSVTFQAEE